MTTGLLLVNLGTPDAPDAPALKRYLAEFLGDRRVVDLPRILWWPILHGIILNTRPAKSAAKYAKIWTPEGSPLKVHTERQAKLVKGLLGHRGIEGIVVAWAMRYGNPSIAVGLDELRNAGVEHIVVLPLYPQFSGSTTASTQDAIAAWSRRNRQAPRPETILDYHEHPAYIGALAQSVRDHWMKQGGRAEKLIMSFHGIPKRAVAKGDPYESQCRRSAELLARELNLEAGQWQLTFQSRFGAAEWLQPYTQPTLEQLARDGVARVDVICPGFPADCLETLEEIAMECRNAFLANGGTEYRYIPCLNERADWIEALTELALDNIRA
ncbi:MAG: ferrochelatase [Gammaproteobacteria bacterium]|nr:ferrochelatase [Gammaproteobacteria bacterium]MBU1415314.1 ferrochelatase [Gammaproteobacteria bacterium]